MEQRTTHKHYTNIQYEANDSWMWRVLLGLRGNLRKYIVHKIGDGKRSIYSARLPDNASVADLITNGSWNWPQECGVEKPFPVQQVRKDVGNASASSVNRYKLIWFAQCHPSHTFGMLLAVQERLLTQDRIQAWTTNPDLKCPLCKQFTAIFFFQCNYSIEIWTVLKRKIGSSSLPNDWKGIIDALVKLNNNNAIRSILRRIVVKQSVQVRKVARELEIVVDAEDISGKIKLDLLKGVGSSDWKIRIESIETVNKIVEEANKRIQRGIV
ncbi:RNA-directed DNA polymerase, eukaryota, reverse transcriptase zinc-binding domain protein [Tanacetum coccineum]